MKDQSLKKVLLASLALAGVSLGPVARAAVIAENFAADPLAHGWQIFGNTNLFRWNPTNQTLEVTWDSTQSNSYFYHPLGTVLTRQDDFSLSFDLELNDIGPADDYLFSFELALGFLNPMEAIQPEFVRGAGICPDVVELAYFRADDYGDPATVYPTCTDTNSTFNYNGYGAGDSTNYTLIVGPEYHLTLSYTAANQTLAATVVNLAGNSSATVIQPLAATFTDFRVDSVSINNYSEAGQYPGFEGSILAHGIVSHLVVNVPPPPIQNLTGAFSNSLWQAQFLSRTNWSYSLERSSDLRQWTNVVSGVSGSGTNLVLSDVTPPGDHSFYRVRTDRP